MRFSVVFYFFWRGGRGRTVTRRILALFCKRLNITVMALEILNENFLGLAQTFPSLTPVNIIYLFRFRIARNMRTRRNGDYVFECSPFVCITGGKVRGCVVLPRLKRCSVSARSANFLRHVLTGETDKR